MNKKDLKKCQDALGYTPSEYQVEIFNAIMHEAGNLFIQARAGSGKTATMIACMKLLPKNKKCVFLAFNKSVRDEIDSKLKDYDNCEVRTVHSLGGSILSSHLGGTINIDEFKYSTYLRRNINHLSSENVYGVRKQPDYIDRILELLDLSRMDLAQSRKEIQKCAANHLVELKYDEDMVVKKLIDWGKKHLESVDYTDLVWLPNELDLVPTKQNKFDFVFNDESQDYSMAYVNLFQKCLNRGGRFVACGDEFQAINQFAGASKEAFEKMAKAKNTKTYLLPISYRCDTKIIEEAQRFVPDIQARPDAELGLMKYDSHIADINDNDMVLSRTNAPLFKLYSMLIKAGKPCYIKGKENDSVKMIDTINKYAFNDDLGKRFASDGLFPRMYKNLIEERNRLVCNGMDIADAIIAPSVQSIYDTIATIDTISIGCDTVSDLIKKIESIYKRTNTGICLTTVHKAKGLESDNVHIICRSEMPNKFGKTEQTLIAERNLLYVAITRAKHKLCYVSEKEFPKVKIFTHSEDDMTEFNYIEDCVCKMFNMEPIREIKKAEIAQVRLEGATKIESIHKNDNKKVIKPTKTPSNGKNSSLMNKLLKQ